MIAVNAKGPRIDIVVSSRAGERLAVRPSVAFEPVGEGYADVAIEDAPGQRMIGFGASFNEAGMIALCALDPPDQERVLEALFDPERGAGLSAMKTVIAATDFMSAGPDYSYAPVPDDTDLEHFSIARDLGPHGLVTYITRARRHGDFVLQATMDYPPDWMLRDPVADQTIDPALYPVLARYFLKYVQAYAGQGIAIDHLSPFNEPGNYTKIGYDGIRDLVRDHLGPLFARAGVATALQVSDAQFRFAAAPEIGTVLDDPQARRFIGSLSYHAYDFLFEQPPDAMTPEALMRAVRPHAPLAEHGYTGADHAITAELARRYPDLPLWMTEICYFQMGPMDVAWLKPLPRADFADGEFWGLQIAREIAAGAAGWTYWNMILDEHGGPALVAPDKGNPERNVQQPVVIVDRRTNEVSYTGLYWYLAHFSRFVRPGSVRLATVGEVAGLTLTAFARPDGARVAVAINSTDRAIAFGLGSSGRVAPLVVGARSIATFVWRED